MRDPFGRVIDYLRISVTDACNLRCVYCMPEDAGARGGILSLEELAEVAREAAALGIRKIRLTGGVARLYRLPGAQGTVGLISPLSRDFCSGCNRIRLTADGYLKPCLHGGGELSVRGLHGEALRERIREAVRQKPERHGALAHDALSRAGRNMNEIGG